VYELLVGSVAEGVVKRSTVPVLLVPDQVSGT
jgi:nucleotide-binding universal stress UspA family protein